MRSNKETGRPGNVNRAKSRAEPRAAPHNQKDLPIKSACKNSKGDQPPRVGGEDSFKQQAPPLTPNFLKKQHTKTSSPSTKKYTGWSRKEQLMPERPGFKPLSGSTQQKKSSTPLMDQEAGEGVLISLDSRFPSGFPDPGTLGFTGLLRPS